MQNEKDFKTSDDEIAINDQFAIEQLVPCFCKKSKGLGERFVTIKNGCISILTGSHRKVSHGKEEPVEKINRDLNKSHALLEAPEVVDRHKGQLNFNIYPLRIRLRSKEKITLLFE